MAALWRRLLCNVGLHIDDNLIKTSQRIEIWTANGLYGGRHLGCGFYGLFALAARCRTFRHRCPLSLCTPGLFILGPVWTFYYIQSQKAPQYKFTRSTTDTRSLKTNLNSSTHNQARKSRVSVALPFYPPRIERFFSLFLIFFGTFSQSIRL